MRSLLVFLFLFPFALQAQRQLTMTGNVAGIPEKTLVSLTDINRPNDTIAKGMVNKGTFVLKAALKEPTLLSLNLTADKKLTLFLDNTKVSVKGKLSDIKNIQVTGSAVQNAFRSFEKVFIPNFEKANQIGHRLQTGERSDSLEGAFNQTVTAIQENIDQFIKDNRSSPVSAFVLLATMNLQQDMALLEKRVNTLQPSALDNSYGEYLLDMIGDAKVTAIGSLATDFTQADTLGKPVSLSSFRGKYVLLDFWASWCRPCRLENPNLVQNFNRFKDKNFTVLGVSLDRPGQKDMWLRAIHEDGLIWTHVSDLQFWNNAVAQLYKVQSIPQNLLIGPDGKIVAKDLRGPALEAKLCEIFGCN